MDNEYALFGEKAFRLFWDMYKDNGRFKNIVDMNMANGKMRFFGEEEYERIISQNFVSPIPDMKEFIDMFRLGYNRGNCVGVSRQLSYSYDDVSIVSGVLPMIKGTLNAEKEGGHGWLETDDCILDTSLMIVMDKSLKDELGYIEESRLTPYDLACSNRYQARKMFVNYKSIKKSSR